jgi:putative cell wall-binding protein
MRKRQMTKLRNGRDNALASARFMREQFPEMRDAIVACVQQAWLDHRALMAMLAT